MLKISNKLLLASASLLIAVSASQTASAQTAPVAVSANVQNTLTLATTQQMNFGSVVAVGDTGNTATVSVDVAGVITVGTTGGAAITAIVDDTLATAAQVTVDDGADGASINVTINNVVDPTDGTDTFTLDGFETNYNNATPAGAPQVIGTPFAVTYDNAFGTNTLDIGATLTTIDPSVTYNDGAYTGSFDVVFAY